MPVSALRYARTVIAAGAFLLALAMAGWETRDASRWLWYLLMAPLASMLKVKLPGLQGTVSPGFAVLLAAVMELGWAETALLAAICGAIQCLWTATKRPGATKVAFNAACMVVSADAAFQLAHWLIPESAAPAGMVRIAIATPALFGANTILVAVMFSLLEGKRALEFWRKIHVWTFPHYVLGAAITTGLLFASSAAKLPLPWLLIPVLYLQHAHQRELVKQTQR